MYSCDTYRPLIFIIQVVRIQGRIQVRLWGGGEFQLVELMYFWVKIKYEFGGTYLQQLIEERLPLI